MLEFVVVSFCWFVREKNMWRFIRDVHPAAIDFNGMTKSNTESNWYLDMIWLLNIWNSESNMTNIWNSESNIRKHQSSNVISMQCHYMTSEKLIPDFCNEFWHILALDWLKLSQLSEGYALPAWNMLRDIETRPSSLRKATDEPPVFVLTWL